METQIVKSSNKAGIDNSDILHVIFLYLDPRMIIRVNLVSTTFRFVGKSKKLWSFIMKHGDNYFGKPGSGIDPSKFPFHDEFYPKSAPTKMFPSFGDWEGGLLFVWGCGSNCLGCDNIPSDGIVPFPTQTPMRNVVQVSCGESITACVTRRGKLFVCGKGSRLGLGGSSKNFSSDSSVPKYTRVRGPLKDLKVVQVSCGESHCGCITSDGHAWVWGKGGKGSLGNGVSRHYNQESPILVCFKDKKPIEDAVFIDCSYLNTAIITRNGDCFYFGSGGYKKSGFGTNEDILFPRKIPGLPPLRMINLGSNYSGAVTRDGDVYTWGYGRAGNLGHGSRKSCGRPKKIRAFVGKSKAVKIACTRNQITLSNKSLKNIDGTENPHTFVLLEDGSAYSFGSSHKGMLGNFRDKQLVRKGCDELVPYKIGGRFRDVKKGPARDSGYLSGIKVIDCISSSIHSSLVGDDGKCYSFGCGSSGRCGVLKYEVGLHGGRSRMKCYISPPTEIHNVNLKKIEGKIVQISSSRRHMACVVKMD